MPLVKLDKNYPAEQLDREIRKQKAELRITNKDMAEWLGISERGLTYKRKYGTYTFADLVIIFDRLGFSIDKIATVFLRGARKEVRK